MRCLILIGDQLQPMIALALPGNTYAVIRPITAIVASSRIRSSILL
jgi:hypothetical protein